MKSWLALTMLVAAAFYLSAVDPVLDLNGDSPRFVMLARSIHDGKGYQEQFAPTDYPDTQIPFLYPLMLTPLVPVSGPNTYTVFKLLSVVCALLALWSMWFWMSQWTTEESARWTVILAAFLVQMQMVAARIATEAPFLAASFACLGFMERTARSDSPKLRDGILCALFIGISFHLRAAGWSLLATFCIVLLLRRGWRAALTGAVAGVFVCSPWLIRLLQYGFAYSDEFQRNTGGLFAFAYRFLYNGAADVAKALPDLLLYPAFSRFVPYQPMFFLKAVIGGGIAAMMAVGFWKYFRSTKISAKTVLPTQIYFIVYLVGALSWTVHGERYLLPILPILLWLVLTGSGSWRPYVTTIVMAVGLTGCVWTGYQARMGSRPTEETGFIEAVDWLRENVSKTDLVMSRYPTWVGTVAGNRGIRWEEADDPASHRKELVEARISWVVVDHNKVFQESAADRLLPLILSDPEEFELHFQSPTQPPTFVYHFVPRH